MRISKILILASLTTAFGCAADDTDDTGAGTGTDPATTDPATTDPATTDPATTDPATTDPATTDPATTDPATTDPATTDPATTDPTESSGTDPDTGSTGGGDENCELYCTVFLATCQDENGGLDGADPYADMDDCMTVCGGFELGMEGDMAGNTLGCRGYHLGVATMVMDAGHCSHADADGTGVCV